MTAAFAQSPPPVTYQAPVSYGVDHPWSVAVADFNGDGIVDLVATSTLTGTVSVRLGNGDGTFHPPASYTVAGYPYSLTTGDFNGDGKLDLVVTNWFGNNVSVLLGNGDGSFQTAVNYTTGNNPVFAVAGDFNGNGKLDLAVLDYGSNDVSILLNNGDGTFQLPVFYQAGVDTWTIAPGDFNGDGKLDLAVASLFDSVSVLLGNGDGTFQPAAYYSAGPSPYSVAAGDLNGDGKPDLVVADYHNGTVNVLLGNGDGTFQPAVSYAAATARPYFIMMGDLNGDGKRDVVVANADGNNLSILLGNGDGSFQPPVLESIGLYPTWVATGDFNGDRRLDLAAANNNSNSISILLQPPAAQNPQPVLQWGLVGTVGSSVVSSNVPVQASIPDAIAVAGGGQFMMALTPDGDVWTWGNNTYGQLGDGTNTDRATPAMVPGLDHVVAISAGYEFALALKDDHTVWAWGFNGYYQLGDGTRTNRNYPAQIAGLTGITAIAAGGHHSLALQAGGSVFSWGADSHGQLGVGYAPGGYASPPVEVHNISNAVAIDAFADSSIAVLADGSVLGWGWNAHGQLGDGTTTDRPLPVSIGVSNAVSVTVGEDAGAALLSSGAVETWGSENHGMLGDGTSGNRFIPAIIPGISNVKQIDAGFFHMVALKQDGTVWAWGSNADWGQLGVGQPAGYGTNVPIQVTAVQDVTYLASGGESTMALGQLTTTADTTPPTVSCAAAPPGWHSDDVSVACTATDSGSGLADSADTSFTLSTDVTAGSETANASTGSLQVCDNAGNCITAGPVTGIMVDRMAPAITITAPTGTYTINQSVAADYSCADGGSGVSTCTGPVTNGAQLSVSSVGAQSFAVTGTDSVGNSATKTNNYTVSYTACILYDPTKAAKSGSTLPIKIQLCDAANQDVSASGIVVHATSVVQTSSSASYEVEDPGNANPDSDFRFDATLGPTGGYIFNLQTKGLLTGTYALTYTAGADPTTHYLYFQVR